VLIADAVGAGRHQFRQARGGKQGGLGNWRRSSSSSRQEARAVLSVWMEQQFSCGGGDRGNLVGW